MKPRIWSILAITAVLLCMPFVFCACEKPREYKLTGTAMGTVYNVRFALVKGVSFEDVSLAVERELKLVDDSMSVFNKNSEISRFNALPALSTQNQPFAVSAELFNLMLFAGDLHAITKGAWDCTIMPLVDLWGFGPAGRRTEPPEQPEIEAVLAQTGFDKINVNSNQTLVKYTETAVDLASIAKGYGVDRISAALGNLGLTSFLVEIGGELYAKGQKPDKSKWRVGISKPSPGMANGEIYAVVELGDMAMATSGNYRNFFISQGKSFAHILDPRTGHPVENNIVSVTVIAPTCLNADGLATAITVMGVEKSMAMAENNPEIDVYIIEQMPDGSFKNHVSSGMRRYLTSR